MEGGILLSVVIGVGLGCVTGLIPGLHVNTVVGIAASLSLLSEQFGLVLLALAITHSIVEFIPTAFFGIPDASTVVSQVPAHRFYQEGRALFAVRLSIIGSMLGGLITLLLYPFWERIISLLALLFPRWSVVAMLVIILLIPLIHFRVETLIVTACAGMLGVISLGGDLLMPLLSGLFGIPALLSSQSGGVCEQRSERIVFSHWGVLPFALLLGMIFSFLPGTGASAAALVGIMVLPHLRDPERLIVVSSALSTINYAFSLATATYLGKARNGAIVGIMEGAILTEAYVRDLIVVMMITLPIAGCVAIALSFGVFRMVRLLDPGMVPIISRGIIAVIVLVAFMLSGGIGLVCLVVSSMIGWYALKEGVQKVSLLSCLMVPTLLLLAGIL